MMCSSRTARHIRGAEAFKSQAKCCPVLTTRRNFCVNCSAVNDLRTELGKAAQNQRG
jgi:hypothetical protein